MQIYSKNGVSLYLLLLKRELKLVLMSPFQLFEPFFYFIIAMIVFKINMGVGKLELNHSTAIFFALQIFSLMIAADTLLINDYMSGILERFYLVYRDLTHVLAVKSMAYVLKSTLLVIMILPIACLLLEIDAKHLFIIATASFLINISTTSLLCISTSLLVSMKNIALLALIVLAFSIPNLIFASLAMQNLAYMKLMIAYLIIFVPIFIYLANQVLKYSFADK